MKKQDLPDSPSNPPPQPIDVMRQTFRDLELKFEEDERQIKSRVILQNVEVLVLSWGALDDVAQLMVHLPIRAAKPVRLKVGEFLHRLNFHAKRKFWEMDFDDGEVRMAVHTDTTIGPLTPQHFGGILHLMLNTADTVFPYITNVLSGAMSAELAADQALAAVQNFSNSEPADED